VSLVIDASALVELLTRRALAGWVESRIVDEALLAPDLINAEVLTVLRRLERRGDLDGAQADAAAAQLIDAPIERVPTQPLIARVWRHRDNLTTYDACYVTLAEALACRLLTVDVRLARAPRLGIPVLSPPTGD
jgi:predicted nucleic acid-binding protein